MSRPTASVPSTCAPNSHCGGFSASARSCALGSYGAIHGASAPATMRISTMPAPTTILGLSNGRIARQRVARIRRPTLPPGASIATLLLKADPRVDETVMDVDHEIDRNERQRIDDDCSGDQRIVPRLDRGNQKRPAARPGKHGFDDNRTTQQRAEFK